jgi:methylenetetrahydrofolate reductase (NADPH)
MELSVEFFPPKTPEGESKLYLVRERFSETLLVQVALLNLAP